MYDANSFSDEVGEGNMRLERGEAHGSLQTRMLANP